MARSVVAVCMLAPLIALASPSQRHAREFLLDTPGTTWTLDGPLGPAEVRTITARRADGTIDVESVDNNRQTGVRTWRLDDGAWIERLSARGKDVVILPAILKVGTRWQWTYTDLLGKTGTHYFVVESLAADVTLKDGTRMTNCVRVRETRPDLGPDLPVMHWFVAGKGEVAEKIGALWYASMSKLVVPAR